MKVLHVIPSVAPCRGGPSEAVLAMTRALNVCGITADIVASNDNGPDVLPVQTGEFIDYEGARVCFLPRWSPRVGALREFQYAPDFSGWLRAHLPDYDGLHVHAVFSYLSTRAMSIARAEGKPFVVRPLGQLDGWSLRQKALKKRLYWWCCEGANVRAAAAIHCTSGMERDNVKALVPDARVEVIPHGVMPQPEVEQARARLHQHLGLADDVPVILFLSRWAAKKNIPLLLRTLAGMTGSKWHLVLAGTASDGYEAVVREAIRSSGLGDRISCPGHVSGMDKALLLHGSEVFVLPSETENFGVAVAEALCCGLRCVVSRGVDIADAVMELNGGTVCDATEESLSGALRQELLAAADGRDGLVKLARQRFAWENPAMKLRELYAEVFA